MENYKCSIAICDDEEAYLEMIVGALKEIIDCKITGYSMGNELLKDIDKISYDLILLDIRLKDISGLEIAQKIYDITGGDNLIFVSCEEQLVFDAISFRPLYFVRKSHFYDDLKYAISKWQEGVKKLCVNVEGVGNTEILTENIVYIESSKHYIIIVDKRGESYKSRCKMDEFERIAENSDIIRIHKSFMCNLKYVARVKYNALFMKDEKELPVSRRYIKNVKDRYNSYYTRI